MDSHNIICTKDAYLKVSHSEICKRARIRSILIIVFCASIIPGIEIYLHGSEAITIGGIIAFFVLVYVFWIVVYKTLRKIAERGVSEMWAKFPSEILRLEIREAKVSIIFENANARPVELERSAITRIETINGCTAIFSDCGKTKDSLAFVATGDVTEELKRRLSRERSREE